MNLLNSMKIGQRMMLGFAIVLGLSVLTTVIALLKLNAVTDATKLMLDEPIRKERLASDWSKNIAIAVARTSAMIKSSDRSLVPFFAKGMAETSRSSAEYIKQMEPMLRSEAEKTAYANAAEIRKTYLSSRDSALKLKEAGRIEESNALLDKVYLPAAGAYQKTIVDFVQVQRKHLDDLNGEIDGLHDAACNLVVLLASLSAVLSVFCAWWLTQGITRPVRAAVQVAQRVAAGDLTVEVKATSSDEIGQLMNALQDMTKNLNRIVGSVRASSDTIATVSAEVASGNVDLSSRTEQQASSIEESAASIEELSTTVQNNAENARQGNQVAASASQIATKGGAVVSQVVDTMGEINKSAKKIVDIISVIDGIAFQTNILALNAAVEAARAGEQGRGFAVVASEVRTLAQRSAAAAKEIKSLIDDSVAKVDAGTVLVNEAGTTIGDVVESVKRVTAIMSEIATASQEQAEGVQQVNESIRQMDQTIQQNAVLVEEAAAATESMQTQAQQLAEAVSVFKLDGETALRSPVLRPVQLKEGVTTPSRPALMATRRVAPTCRSVAATAGADAEWETF